MPTAAESKAPSCLPPHLALTNNPLIRPRLHGLDGVGFKHWNFVWVFRVLHEAVVRALANPQGLIAGVSSCVGNADGIAAALRSPPCDVFIAPDQIFRRLRHGLLLSGVSQAPS